jgi:hypothetical protein
MEIWKDIQGYEGIYMVSNFGNIKTLSTNKISNGWEHNKYGHRKVRLYKNKKAKDFYLHRLVAIAFISQVESKPHINHIDSNPNNNASSNLEWCTHVENMNHARLKGRMGSNSSSVKVKNIITGEVYKSIKAAAIANDITPNTLVYSLRRKSHKYKFIKVD